MSARITRQSSSASSSASKSSLANLPSRSNSEFSLQPLSETLPSLHPPTTPRSTHSTSSASTSLRHHSTPVRSSHALSVSTSEASATSTASRLQEDLKGRQFVSRELLAFFVESRTEEEKRVLDGISWDGELGKESTMLEIGRAVSRAVEGEEGDARIVSSGGSNMPIRPTEPDRYERDNPPDVVILTRDSASEPKIRAEWYKPSSATEGRHYEQLAAVGEVKHGRSARLHSDAKSQIRRRLLRIAVTPIRTHTFGFTLVNSTLVISLLTASGLFFTPDIECTLENKVFTLFLIRLLGLSELQLGIVASNRSPPLDLSTPLHLPALSLPPSSFPLSFIGTNPLDKSSLEIIQLITRRSTATGRCTSTFRVKVGTGFNSKEYALSVVFVEQNRLEEHDLIRRTIAAASPSEREGLSNVVDVCRGEFMVGVPFLRLEELEEAIPRALELTFYEECYRSIYEVDSTLALAKAILGLVKGHHNLYKLGFLHRDISDGNAMLDRAGNGVLIDYNLSVSVNSTTSESVRKHRSGTRPFLSRALLDVEETGGVTHEIWHDFESMVYLIFSVAFRKNPTSSSLSAMSHNADAHWTSWNSRRARDAFKDKTILKLRGYSVGLVKACQPGWDRLDELVDVIRDHCGFRRLLIESASPAEEDRELVELVRDGTVSHDTLTTSLSEFIETL
ncbi:hypothetical protein P7C70_g9054, partial [Phenoliferia sp. Uapishka_3]